MVAPNISTYQLADASGSLLIMWTGSNLNAGLLIACLSSRYLLPGYGMIAYGFEWSAAMFPPNDKLVICFAHVAYRMHERFSALNTGINSFAVRDPETLEKRVGEADVLVISGLWHNGLLDRAKNLRLIQAIGAGTDQFPRDALAKRAIRLASAREVNYRAVAEHAMALILALSRRLPEARDNQAKRVWRGMIGDPDKRADELGGKTLLIAGFGQIGGRRAQVAK